MNQTKQTNTHKHKQTNMMPLIPVQTKKCNRVAKYGNKQQQQQQQVNKT
jgi:hypothetical protein